jgi:hypothetical protein
MRGGAVNHPARGKPFVLQEKTRVPPTSAGRIFKRRAAGGHSTPHPRPLGFFSVSFRRPSRAPPTLSKSGKPWKTQKKIDKRNILWYNL